MSYVMPPLLQFYDDFGHWLHPSSLIMILIFGTPIVAIVATYWHRTIKTRAEIELKQHMVEQGMSADEIERVLAARSPR